MVHSSFFQLVNILIFKSIVWFTLFSRTHRKEEHRLIKEIRTTFDKLELIEIPLQPIEPRGIDNLYKFADLLYG